jgi:hypothetical protein
VELLSEAKAQDLRFIEVVLFNSYISNGVPPLDRDLTHSLSTFITNIAP